MPSVNYTVRTIALIGMLALAFSVRALSDDPPDPVAALGYWQVTNADFVMEPGPNPPGMDAHWRNLRIPDRWAEEKRWRLGLTGWYRIRMPDAIPALQQAVYLQRISTNAQVYLNQTFVGSGGSFDEPAARNMHRPLLFVLPHSAWQESDNYLYLHLRVYPGFAHVVGVRVGNLVDVQPMYERQYFMQTTLSQGFFSIALLTAIAGLVFWLLIERTQTNLYFGLTALCWSFYSLNLFIRDTPVAARVWWWIVHTNIELACVFFVVFGHRLLGAYRPWVERLLFAYAAFAATIYALVEFEQVNAVSRQLHLCSILVLGYLTLWLLWRYYVHRRIEALVLGGSLIGMIMLAANDLVRHTVPVTSANWQTPFYLLQFGAPAMFVILAAYLFSRYARAEREAMIGKLKEQQALLRERDRIYQDLHDDVGAKLLSLVYRAKTTEEADLARSALADMRDIISDKALVPTNLVTLLNTLHTEVEARCLTADLMLSFEHATDAAIPVSGEFAHHFTKVTRELVSNSLRHADATQVTVIILLQQDQLRMVYEDNGKGLPEKIAVGRGMAGIRRRVSEMQGHFALDEQRSRGFRCEVLVPIARSGLQLDDD